MATPILQQVCVRTPATTANLGSGFDVFGLALQLYNTYTLRLTSTPGWRVKLPPHTHLPTNGDNLFYRAAARVFEQVDCRPDNLQVELDINIPLTRGLGSSSSAVIGGLVAANTLTGSTLDLETLLAMAIEIEGHPDNVTPALMGGMTLTCATETNYHALSLPFPTDIQIVVAIPDFELSTVRARSILPARVSRSDAVFNSSRTALMTAALYQKRYDLLATAMDDRLHQPYRTELVPGMEDAIAAGYEAKALGVALSGAGPTLMAMTQEDGARIATALRTAFECRGITCETNVLQVDTAGTIVLGKTACV